VHPVGTQIIDIGNWNTFPPATPVEALFPFAFNWSQSLAQFIYYEEEIGTRGFITQITLRYNNAISALNLANIPRDRQLPIRVYMGIVERSNFASPVGPTSWIPASELQHVFEGTFDIWTVGDNQYLVMDLDTPFYYSGGNLAVMTHRVASPNGPGADPGLGAGNWWAGINWHLHPLSLGNNRSIRHMSDALPYLSASAPHPTLNPGFVQNIPMIRFKISDTFPLPQNLGGITGTIFGMGEPLAGVRVEITGAGETIFQTTSETGVFMIGPLFPGTYHLTASRNMYLPLTINNIFVHPGQWAIQPNISMSGVQADLVAVGLAGPVFGSAGQPMTFRFTIRNDAVMPTSAYTVRLMREGVTAPLATATGVNIASAATHTFDLEWTPTAEGTFTVYAEVVFAADQFPNNNRSNNIVVNVSTAGAAAVSIPINEPTTNHRNLFDYWWNTSLNQVIFYEDELTYGLIHSIMYKFVGGTGMGRAYSCYGIRTPYN
jgi:hypothetical protein